MPENPSDFRNSPRAPIELKVEYRKVNSFFADYTKNISKGGTFIKTKKPLPVGTQFLFKLSVPHREAPFELLGEVAWARGDGEEPGMGIRFVYTDPRQRADFESVVEKMMHDSLGPLLSGRLLEKPGKT
ncbi:MAG: TIGR02266 family protein [Myxococcales bacterium]